MVNNNAIIMQKTKTKCCYCRSLPHSSLLGFSSLTLSSVLDIKVRFTTWQNLTMTLTWLGAKHHLHHEFDLCVKVNQERQLLSHHRLTSKCDGMNFKSGNSTALQLLNPLGNKSCNVKRCRFYLSGFTTRESFCRNPRRIVVCLLWD